MCDDYNIQLLGKIPLDPKIMLSAETGVGIIDKHPDSIPAL